VLQYATLDEQPAKGSKMQRAAVHYNVLQCVAVRYSRSTNQRANCSEMRLQTEHITRHSVLQCVTLDVPNSARTAVRCFCKLSIPASLFSIPAFVAPRMAFSNNSYVVV